MENAIGHRFAGVSLALFLLLTTVSAVQNAGAGQGADVRIIQPMPRACNDEAKICPDGTAVGRTGPNCEFALCPPRYLSMGVYTDKSEYKVGDEARITATLKSDLDTSSATVYANVEKPNGETEIIHLPMSVCIAAECLCVEGETCTCPAPSCQFEGKIDVKQEGTYYITANAELSGMAATAESKFSGYRSSYTTYVHLGDKFELAEGSSAVVVDYGDMRMTLGNILYSKCGVGNAVPVTGQTETAEAIPVNSPEVSAGNGNANSALMPKCIGGPAYAIVKVRAPLNAVGTYSVPALTADSYTETEVSIEEGKSVFVFGAKISLGWLNGDRGSFIITSEGEGNYLDVKIVPTSNSVELGDTASYKITVKDLHDSWEGKTYTYDVNVFELPFSLDYPRTITLDSGDERTIKLSVHTSAIKTDASEAATVPETAVGTLPTVTGATSKAVATVSASAAAEKVTIAPDVVASGRAYNFKVVVSGHGSSATAYGVLNILYSPPPPPYNKVKIGINQGWNLIALPGTGDLSSGTCSGIDELYAFVYLRNEGRYVTLEDAAALMGEEGLKEYMRLNSFWVYSFNSCAMEFKMQSATSLSEISLGEGWNFVPITQDMEGRTLGDIGGDCDFSRAYLWNAGGQNWDTLEIGDKFSAGASSKGFIAKVSKDCSFGWGAIIAPPPLPA